MRHRILITLVIGLSVVWAGGAQSSLYDLSHIVDIQVTIPLAQWHPVLDSLKERGFDQRLVADVVVDGKSFPGAGIRYKGNSSYFNVRNNGYRKLPFNIKLDHTDDDLELPGGINKLKLSNVFRDPSFLREVLSYEIAGKYMPVSRCNYARLTVNGQYMGLYNLSESVEDEMIERFFGEDDGVMFKCDPLWHTDTPEGCPEGHNASLEFLGPDSLCYQHLYEIKSDHGWGELIRLAHHMDQAPQGLDTLLNVDEALWMLAFNNVLVNLDSYTGRLCHNYYLYLDQYGVWHPILWDLNLSFGGFRYPGLGTPLSNQAMQEMSMFLHFKQDNDNRPLILRMLEDDFYRKLYLAHIRTIVEENFANGWYKERAAEIRKMIEPEVARDSFRLYDYELFDRNLDSTVRVDNASIIGITELMDRRSEYILTHPLMQKTPPDFVHVDHEVGSDFAVVSAEVTDAEKLWLYHRAEDYLPWRRVAMTANGETVWSGQFPLIDGAGQYYLVAENERSARCSPERASFVFHAITPE